MTNKKITLALVVIMGSLILSACLLGDPPAPPNVFKVTEPATLPLDIDVGQSRVISACGVAPQDIATCDFLKNNAPAAPDFFIHCQKPGHATVTVTYSFGGFDDEDKFYFTDIWCENGEGEAKVDQESEEIEQSEDIVESTYRIVNVEDNDTLNIREQAGVDFEVIGEIPPDGAGILIVGSTKDINGSTWVQIDYLGIRGWVNDSYLEIEEKPASEVEGGEDPLLAFTEVKIPEDEQTGDSKCGETKTVYINNTGEKIRVEIKFTCECLDFDGYWTNSRIYVEGDNPDQQKVQIVKDGPDENATIILQDEAAIKIECGSPQTEYPEEEPGCSWVISQVFLVED